MGWEVELFFPLELARAGFCCVCRSIFRGGPGWCPGLADGENRTLDLARGAVNADVIPVFVDDYINNVGL